MCYNLRRWIRVYRAYLHTSHYSPLYQLRLITSHRGTRREGKGGGRGGTNQSTQAQFLIRKDFTLLESDFLQTGQMIGRSPAGFSDVISSVNLTGRRDFRLGFQSVWSLEEGKGRTSKDGC